MSTEIIDSAAVGELLGISKQTIPNLVGKGLPFTKRGAVSGYSGWLFQKDQVLLWWEQYNAQKAKKSERTRAEAQELTEAKIAKLNVETRRLENKLLEEQLVLIPIEDVAEFVEREYQNVRGQLLAVASKASPAVQGMTNVREIDHIITKYIREALEELTTGKRIVKKVQEKQKQRMAGIEEQEEEQQEIE